MLTNVERHVIKRTDPRWKEIDQAAFAAKNMYNAANYLMRQAFIFQGERILGFNALYHQAKPLPADQELPSKVAQQVLKILQQKRNNQNFVSISHARLIAMLTYKAELRGLKVILTEESYTSKCSFLDDEALCHHATYAGKRVKRGLFWNSQGRRINADVNGAYNIIRKVAPQSFGQGVEGVVVRPGRLAA